MFAVHVQVLQKDLIYFAQGEHKSTVIKFSVDEIALQFVRLDIRI